MEKILTEFLLQATALAVITLAVVQGVKQALPIPQRFIGLVSIGVGILLGWATMSIMPLPLPQALWIGGLSGLVASGAFTSAKKALRKQKEEEADDKSNDIK